MLTVFEKEGFQVRTVVVDDETLFVAADLSAPLDISNIRDKVALLDDDEKLMSKIQTGGQRRDVTVLTEPGLISLMLSCPKSRKKDTSPWRYRRWVTHEVLPAIHRTGEYKLQIAHITELLAGMTTERDTAVTERDTVATERDAAVTERDKLSVGVVQKVKEVLGFPTHNTSDQWRVVCDVMSRLKAASLTENGPDRVVFRLPVEEAIAEALPLIRRHLPEATRYVGPGWKQPSLKRYFGER
jgi:prophage antirepressor-like protein